MKQLRTPHTTSVTYIEIDNTRARWVVANHVGDWVEADTEIDAILAVLNGYFYYPDYLRDYLLAHGTERLPTAGELCAWARD